MIKVCGARCVQDRALRAAAGGALAGGWCGVPGGHADLPPPDAGPLLAAGRPQPVLVTLRGTDVPELADRTGARWVQLHGHQPPGLVRTLKSRGHTVIKVLHLLGERCLQEGLIPAYERAGTDFFLLDTATAGGRLGSTGRRADPAALDRLAARLRTPFLLAGGITASRAGYAGLVRHPGFAGVDVDSAARDAGGALDPRRVAALTAAWAGDRA